MNFLDRFLLNPFENNTTQKQDPQVYSDSLQVQTSRRPSDPSSLDPVLLRSAKRFLPSEHRRKWAAEVG